MCCCVEGECDVCACAVLTCVGVRARCCRGRAVAHAKRRRQLSSRSGGAGRNKGACRCFVVRSVYYTLQRHARNMCAACACALLTCGVFSARGCARREHGGKNTRQNQLRSGAAPDIQSTRRRCWWRSFLVPLRFASVCVVARCKTRHAMGAWLRARGAGKQPGGKRMSV